MNIKTARKRRPLAVDRDIVEALQRLQNGRYWIDMYDNPTKVPVKNEGGMFISFRNGKRMEIAPV